MTIQDTDPGSKSAAEVEREVQHSRAEVERTLDQIQDRLSPGQMVDQAMNYFRDSGGSEVARNLGESVKQNPMPLALVAVGVAWMMMSSRQPDDRGRYLDDDVVGGEPEASPLYPAARAPLHTGTTASWRTDHDAGGDQDENDGSGAVDRARDAARAAREKASELVDRAREAASDVVEGAAAQADGLSGKAQESAASVRARALDAQARARRYGRRARHGVLETFYQQPLVLGAIGVAVGAAIGAALPPTETEDELIGDTGDRIKREADRTGREQLAKAQSAADAAASAALAEADRQGLRPDSAKAAADSVRSKVERVAEAATEAGEDQAEKDNLGGKRGVT